jgi:glycosyltransferase involved in cell wall biosynthesis
VDLELIVVDDGSRDRTAEIATRYQGVRLVRHRSNHGYGAALKTGFAQARGDWLGFLDADGTYPPEHFPILIGAGPGATSGPWAALAGCTSSASGRWTRARCGYL